mgnify:CR=1 FL=1
MNPHIAVSTISPYEPMAMAPLHWVNAQTERYYSARLMINLFGQWELEQAWGSLKSQRGRVRYVPLTSQAEVRIHLATLGSTP